MNGNDKEDYLKAKKAKQNFFTIALLLLWFVILCAVKLKWINGI